MVASLWKIPSSSCSNDGWELASNKALVYAEDEEQHEEADEVEDAKEGDAEATMACSTLFTGAG